MANRSMAAKHARHIKQSREAGWMEASKSGLATCKPVVPDSGCKFDRLSPPHRPVAWFDRSKPASQIEVGRKARQATCAVDAAYQAAYGMRLDAYLIPRNR